VVAKIKAGAEHQAVSLLAPVASKANGGQRPLSIPTIKDRVVQTAVLLVINPVFDTDLSPRQYGFRSHIDAKWQYAESTLASLNASPEKSLMRIYLTTSVRSPTGN